MSLELCHLIDLPQIPDARGNLTFVEGRRHVPFEIQRVFYIYDVPCGGARGGHALKTCHQVLIAVAGSLDVIVKDDRGGQRRFQLDSPRRGLHLPPRIWREMENFSAGSVCLVLASTPFEEADYYRSYADYCLAEKATP